MFQVNAYWFYDFGQVVRAVLEWANSPRLVDDRALKAFVDADDFLKQLIDPDAEFPFPQSSEPAGKLRELLKLLIMT